MNASENSPSGPRLDRRSAIKWMFTAAAATTLLDHGLTAAATTAPAGVGYGTDPDVLKIYKPGDVWPLTFTASQRVTAAALCDVIIPADASGPSASSVGVPDFIDEWVSAPYPSHDADRTIVLAGLAWLDAESRKRFQNDFVNLVARQKNAICDDICFVPKAEPEFLNGAHFFKRFRDLTAGGYYTTPEGMKDIGYIGNVPLDKFEGPPIEVLQKLGLA
jgi:Gluconate 2-dehydrogenase subunit 3